MLTTEIIDICILNADYDIVEIRSIHGKVLQQANGFKIIRQYNERNVLLTHALTVDVEVSGNTYTCLLKTHEKHLAIKQAFEEAVEDDRYFEDIRRAERSTEVSVGEKTIPT